MRSGEKSQEPSWTLMGFHVPDQHPTPLPISQGPVSAQPRPSVPARQAQGLWDISLTLREQPLLHPGNGTLLVPAHITLKNSVGSLHRAPTICLPIRGGGTLSHMAGAFHGSQVSRWEIWGGNVGLGNKVGTIKSELRSNPSS